MDLTQTQDSEPISLVPIHRIVLDILADRSLTYAERGVLIWFAAHSHAEPGFAASAMDVLKTLDMSLPTAKQALRSATHIGYLTPEEPGKPGTYTRFRVSAKLLDKGQL